MVVVFTSGYDNLRHKLLRKMIIASVACGETKQWNRSFFFFLIPK